MTETADDTVFAATLAMDRLRPVIDDLVEALLAQRMPVELYYPESGPGQHEIAIRYAPAVTAADRQVAFRETTHAIANRHGLRASFLPKVVEGKANFQVVMQMLSDYLRTVSKDHFKLSQAGVA